MSGACDFVVLPSIDLRGGMVVDLYQGDFTKETIYDDPAEEVARRFLAEGARWIHVIDLDGSRQGAPANAAVIARLAAIARQGEAELEVGGGIRTLEAAQAALSAGASRVVMGTVALERPELVGEAVRTLGAESVVVGIDARGGRVATRGWVRASDTTATDLARRMVDLGVVRFIYTDINRDSTLTEPNFEELARLSEAVDAAVIASGGVTSSGQIQRLAAMRLEGAIVGSALYAGRLTLAEALAAAEHVRAN